MARDYEKVAVEESYVAQVQDAIKKFKLTHYLSALLMVAAGVFLVIRPGTALETLCTVLGACVTFAGAFYAIAYFLRGKLRAVLGMDLVLGLLLAVAGILILTHPKAVISMIPVALGVVLFVSALAKLQTAFDMKRLGVTRWWISLLFALITIVLAVILIRNPFAVMSGLVVYVGISFIVDGVLTLFSMIALGANLRRVKRLEEKEVIDVEAEEKPLEW